LVADGFHLLPRIGRCGLLVVAFGQVSRGGFEVAEEATGAFERKFGCFELVAA
jgi:hypothetical protein